MQSWPSVNLSIYIFLYSYICIFWNQVESARRGRIWEISANLTKCIFVCLNICIFLLFLCLYISIFVYLYILYILKSVQCSRRAWQDLENICKLDQVTLARDSIFLQTTQKTVRDKISANAFFLAGKIPKTAYSKTKDPWNPFLWRWLMFVIFVVMHRRRPRKPSGTKYQQMHFLARKIPKSLNVQCQILLDKDPWSPPCDDD